MVYVVPTAIELFHQLLNSIILPIVPVYIADEDSPYVLDGIKVWGVRRPRKKTDIVVRKVVVSIMSDVGRSVVLLKDPTCGENSATNGRKPASSILRYRLELIAA